jgi:hypothetical protein
MNVKFSGKHKYLNLIYNIIKNIFVIINNSLNFKRKESANE